MAPAEDSGEPSACHQFPRRRTDPRDHAEARGAHLHQRKDADC